MQVLNQIQTFENSAWKIISLEKNQAKTRLVLGWIFIILIFIFFEGSLFLSSN